MQQKKNACKRISSIRWPFYYKKEEGKIQPKNLLKGNPEAPFLIDAFFDFYLTTAHIAPKPHEQQCYRKKLNHIQYFHAHRFRLAFQ